MAASRVPQAVRPLFGLAPLFLPAGMIALAACGLAREPETPDAAQYAPVAVRTLPGWESDALDEALPAWRRSCERIAAAPGDRAIGPGAGTAADWRAVCAGLPDLSDGDTEAVRRFVEANFIALRVTAGSDPEGLFTGYFEPIIKASRARTESFREPIYALPRDHVSARLDAFGPGHGGRSIVGRVERGRLVPYLTRGEIADGALGDAAEILFWARDPLDVFILHVQGSGVVELPDGTRTRIGYAGHNGHDYMSVGRWLIERGELRAGRADWEDIRAWLEANPDLARDALAVNRRFIFFRETDGDGAVGAAGVVLTAGRSLAVDPAHMPLNVPVWLDAEHPDGRSRLRRLMLAQDTGNAIRGIVRGDFYWGTGRAALDQAGRMKSRGAYYILVPATLAPTG